LGFASLLAAMGMMGYGMLLRIVISGRGPVTNMFETIVWASFVSACIAVTLGLVYRQRIIPTAAALVVALSTLLAHNMPADMGASISPLQPVLRSNYWLVVHVMTIVASYGAFMLAWMLGNVGLFLYILGVDRPQVIKPMALFTYRSMQVGVLLLASGTILGGWWAAESWGRFWGWDPKEVWALIALLGYLAILHARIVGLVKLFGLLAGAVLGFLGVVMSWYGVNFLLGAGLHAYAFGDGGRVYVIGAAILNIVYVLTAYLVHSARGAQRNADAQFQANADELDSESLVDDTA
jgi:ABC-type transport system involved in cytochrome c biogenesis permease subunit